MYHEVRNCRWISRTGEMKGASEREEERKERETRKDEGSEERRAESGENEGEA